jgi:hypothetical protein
MDAPEGRLESTQYRVADMLTVARSWPPFARSSKDTATSANSRADDAKYIHFYPKRGVIAAMYN